MARGVGRGMKKKNEAGKGSNIESIKIEKRDRGERMRKTIYDDDCVRVCVKYIYIYIYLHNERCMEGRSHNSGRRLLVIT